MKTISLFQPWAGLVCSGAKKIETRSWETSHRGLLAIHASLKTPRELEIACLESPDVLRELLACGLARLEPTGGRLLRMPRGAVVAVCRLCEVARIWNEKARRAIPWLDQIPAPDSPEYVLGDYTPGRFMWFLDDVRQLPEPVPARGRPGLWDWEPPVGLLESLGLSELHRKFTTTVPARTLRRLR